jgi:hypothetical protein
LFNEEFDRYQGQEYYEEEEDYYEDQDEINDRENGFF